MCKNDGLLIFVGYETDFFLARRNNFLESLLVAWQVRRAKKWSINNLRTKQQKWLFYNLFFVRIKLSSNSWHESE